MRFRWLSIVSAMCLVLVLPVAVAAEPGATVYHGPLTDGWLRDCAGVDTQVPTWGNWSATISPGTAVIHANEFHDWGYGPVHWVAMGGAAWGKWTVDSATPGSFHLWLMMGTMRVDAYLNDGEINWHLAPYGDCAAADVYGEVR